MWTQACKPKGITYRAIRTPRQRAYHHGRRHGLDGCRNEHDGRRRAGLRVAAASMGTPAPMAAVPAVGMPVSAPPTAPTMNSVNITVPDNMRTGDTMQVAAPDGSGVAPCNDVRRRARPDVRRADPRGDCPGRQCGRTARRVLRELRLVIRWASGWIPALFRYDLPRTKREKRAGVRECTAA